MANQIHHWKIEVVTPLFLCSNFGKSPMTYKRSAPYRVTPYAAWFILWVGVEHVVSK